MATANAAKGKLAGETAIVTAAGQGLGEEISKRFAQEGANLALCTSAKMKELHAVADEARAFGVKVVAEQCDVAEPASVAAFVDKVKEIGRAHV